MPDCPRCHQPVDSQAIACPYCRATLKAYGHPGITLHRATDQDYLCDSCTYHEDDTCTFPQRPYAQECTLYRNMHATPAPSRYTPSLTGSIRIWLSQNAVVIVLAGLLLISVAIALSRQ